MSTPAPPPFFKPLLPFLKRADELSRQKSKATHIVAYFCRQYAVQLGLKLLDSHPDQQTEATSFLLPIMDDLEAFKRDVGAPSQEDGKV